MTQPTETQRRLAALAAQLAVANPDAAEYLATVLAQEAERRKRVQGFGIEVRWNEVSGRAELRSGE